MTFYFFLGGIFASLTASYIFNKIGRIKSYIILGLLEIIVQFSGLIINTNVLYTVRFFNGYIGCFYTFLAPLMLMENLPQYYKEKFDNIFYFFLTSGIMTAFSFGFDFIKNHW